MALVDDIKARVQAKDLQRIEARADAAASVADAHELHAAAVEALSSAAKNLSEKITAARGLMTVDELGEFTGISVKELAPATAGRSVKPVRRPASKTKKAQPTDNGAADPTEN